jgi:hypothetical protein
MNKWTTHCQNNYIYENRFMWSVFITTKLREKHENSEICPGCLNIFWSVTWDWIPQSISVLWDLTMQNFLDRYIHFGGTCNLHLLSLCIKVPLKHWYLSTNYTVSLLKRHCIFIFTAVRTSNFTYHKAGWNIKHPLFFSTFKDSILLNHTSLHD